MSASIHMPGRGHQESEAGPRAVAEKDMEGLGTIIEGFTDQATASSKKADIESS